MCCAASSPGRQLGPGRATIAVVAQADVPDADIDQVVAEAEEQLASGEVEEPQGPVVATVEVDGRPISYAPMGDGDEVVVLVHGYGATRTPGCSCRSRCRAAAPCTPSTCPATAQSGKDVGDGSLDTLAATVLGFLDAVGAGRATWSGTRWAGRW